jgi:PTH1 family peptidyl-tRNA hydrolase
MEYARTRHNIGFDVVDYMAATAEVPFTSEKYCDIARIKVRGKQVILIKPTTYMNLSGKAVNFWMQAERIPIDKLLVITDDIALPEGTIRLRLKGSDGGHNGLKDINEVLNNSNYARLRFGVGNDFPKGRQADYVLSPWPDEQLKLIEDKIKTAADAVHSFVSAGPVQTMNRFNTRENTSD